MSEPTTTPAKLQDHELESLAAQWRVRAMQGDQLADRMARALEAEQHRRISSLQDLTPADPPRVGTPWWKFWLARKS
ncbi:MAG: hypothetical protein EOP82_14125 [Variovorax sp.]|nr:MAG: hypothetical protein EOP82_14125 [Variovorax sp.]